MIQRSHAAGAAACWVPDREEGISFSATPPPPPSPPPPPPSPPSFAVNCNKEVDAGVGAFCLSLSSFVHHYTAEWPRVSIGSLMLFVKLRWRQRWQQDWGIVLWMKCDFIFCLHLTSSCLCSSCSSLPAPRQIMIVDWLTPQSSWSCTPSDSSIKHSFPKAGTVGKWKWLCDSVIDDKKVGDWKWVVSCQTREQKWTDTTVGCSRSLQTQKASGRRHWQELGIASLILKSKNGLLR